MDNIRKKKIQLHSRAKIFLFEHFATLRRLFSDVLGQLGIDYLSIALINEKGEIFFLSSSPSIEQNLIEKGLWKYDGTYQLNFIYQDKPKLWSELPHARHHELLKQYKQRNHSFLEGISMSVDYQNYRAIFSFGFKKWKFMMKEIPSSHYKKLLGIGLFCLEQIKESIIFPDKKGDYRKPHLKLIINNKSEFQFKSKMPIQI